MRGVCSGFARLPARRWLQAGSVRGLKNLPLADRVRRVTFSHEVADKYPQLEIEDPANGTVLGTVPDMGVEGAEAATAAAWDAWRAWRDVPPLDRGNLLYKWHRLVMDHADDLAIMITSESGKPLAEGKGEVMYAASFIDFFAGETRRLEGCVMPALSASKRVLGIKQPVGPAALITPWNFPAAMITRKAAAALAAGCPVVIKPAEATPFTALALRQLALEAGFPPAAFAVVTSSRASVPAIGTFFAKDPRLRKLSFTGSTIIGKLLLTQAAAGVKRVSMELGGNAPFIVCADADLDAAADGLIASKFRNAGQTCVSANRVLVASEVMDAFAAAVCARVAKLKMGHGLDEGVTVGPLISAAAVAKVQAHVEDAKSKGASVLCGGNAVKVRFFEPTVLANVDAAMRCWAEETFGPLVPLVPFSSPAEALALANDSSAGLASYLYTKDLNTAWRMAEGLEFGMVGVNEGIISSTVGPFGGIKESGLGREGSKYGMDEYLEVKYVCMGLGPPIDGLPNLP